ncbi:MAG: SOS response-associated peptidase [Alphaproteobacteria bacterium]|nr:SOS response-associated peptidase [Alphaproteobacteria bacterium]
MCGRFSNATTPDQLKATFNVQLPQSLSTTPHGGRGHNAEPRWNIAPSHEVDAMTAGSIATGGQKMMRTMIWGVATPKSPRPLINARSETMFEKPTFRTAARKQRCAVVASGWFEWLAPKQPYYIHRRDGQPMAMAGLYWRDGDVSRCVVVTTAADDGLSAIHHRAPLVLAPQDLDAWLDPAHGEDSLAGIIAPSPASGFDWYPVSHEVGSTRVNHRRLIARDDHHGIPPEPQMSLF